MSEKASRAGQTTHLAAPLPRSGQDWATWLVHARTGHPPGTPNPSPARAEAAWTTLLHLARRAGFTVERADCAAGQGFTTWRNRRIRIAPSLTSEQAVTALAHQLGHVLLHAQTARLEPSGTVPCTGIRKVEADSVAYLTAAHLGLDAGPVTFPHVSSWAGTDPRARPDTTIQTVTHRILTAAAKITARLDADLSPSPASTQPAPTAGAEETLPTGPSAAVSDLVSVHEDAARFFRDRLRGSWVPGYLASRGFPHPVQQRWQAGYAHHSWNGLTRHLRAAGYPDSLIEAAGLARRSQRGVLTDTFRDRAMLPIRSSDGTIIGFIGRASPSAGPEVPKYLNSPATRLYDKSEVLFGLWEARGALAKGARPVLVEGPLDAIAVTTACPGRYAGLAPCGAVLTARQAEALDHAAGLSTTGVLVAFDADNAGRRAAVKAYHLLSPLTDATTAVIFPAGQDPAQILQDRGPAALARTVDSCTRPLADLVIDAEVGRWDRWLRYPEGQIGALRAAAPLIAAMPPAHVARQVGRLAERLGLDHPTVTEAVTTALTEMVATGKASSSHNSAAPGPNRQDRPPASVSAASRDSAHTAQQAIGQATAVASAHHPRRSTGAAQDRLRTSRALS